MQKLLKEMWLWILTFINASTCMHVHEHELGNGPQCDI